MSHYRRHEWWRNPNQYHDENFQHLHAESDVGPLSCEVAHDHHFGHSSAVGGVENVQTNIKSRPLESVTKALADTDKFHTITSHITRVTNRYVRQQLTSLVELATNDLINHTGTSTRTQLLDLNDDCLFEIFSLKYITVMDLCSVAKTSTHLNHIAKRIFTIAHKRCIFRSFVSSVYETKRIIVTFGSLMTGLSIDGSKFDRREMLRLVDLLIQCNTLEALSLNFCVIPEYLTDRLNALFKKLQELEMKNCTFWRGCKKVLADCVSLRKLKIVGVTIDLVHTNIFPQLEQFQYEADTLFNWEFFISKHHDLKLLSIWTCDYRSSLCPIIANNCKQLEKLRTGIPNYENILDYADDLRSLTTLDKLKELEIFCSGQNVTKFIQDLQSSKSIECLAIESVQSDSKFMLAISKLKRLKILKLSSCEGLKNLNLLGDLDQLTELPISSSKHLDLDLPGIIQHLINLEHLVLHVESLKINESMYLRIVDVVRGRPERSLKRLLITCSTSCYKVNDLQYVEGNGQIVKLLGAHRQ